MAARQNIGKFEYAILRFEVGPSVSSDSSADGMRISFKVLFFAICVNSRFNFHCGNRTLPVCYSKLFCHKFREVLKFGPQVLSICRSCYVLPSLGYLPLCLCLCLCLCVCVCVYFYVSVCICVCPYVKLVEFHSSLII